MLKDVKLEMKWNIFGKQQRIAADLLINEAKCSSNVFSLHTFGVSEQFYFLVGSIASAFVVLVCLWKWDALWCPNCRLLFDEFGANWEVYPNMIANVVKMLNSALNWVWLPMFFIKEIIYLSCYMAFAMWLEKRLTWKDAMKWWQFTLRTRDGKWSLLLNVRLTFFVLETFNSMSEIRGVALNWFSFDIIQNINTNNK